MSRQQQTGMHFVIWLLVLLVATCWQQTCLAKSYVVTSIESHTYLTTETVQTCGWRVEEIITYNFTGKYSRFGRSIPTKNNRNTYVTSPYADLSTSLSSGYEMKSNISKELFADFVVTYLTPSTPTDDTTIIKVKLNYRVNNAFYSSYYYPENYVVMIQIFDYDAPSFNINTTWHFDGFEEYISDPTFQTSSSFSFFSPNQSAYQQFAPWALLDVKALPGGKSLCSRPPPDLDLYYLFFLLFLIPIIIIVALYLKYGGGCDGSGGDGGGGGGDGGDGGGNYSSFNDNSGGGCDSGGGGGGGGDSGGGHGTSGFAD